MQFTDSASELLPFPCISKAEKGVNIKTKKQTCLIGPVVHLLKQCALEGGQSDALGNPISGCMEA